MSKVLMTLANEGYVNMAKQLFSSAYWKGGWDGDYLLLAHNIPEDKLKWFRDKGIIVKPVELLSDRNLGLWGAIVSCKLNILDTWIKKWDNALFLDADMIIRKDIKDLGNVNRFNAVFHGTTFEDQFNNYNKDKIYDNLKHKFKPARRCFNAGTMAFSTDVITEDTFKDAMKFLRLHESGNNFELTGDEAVFNVIFPDWKDLSLAYNLVPYFIHANSGSPAIETRSINKVKGVILHFICYCDFDGWGKPWRKMSHFRNEWHQNLLLAEHMDIKNPVVPYEMENIDKYIKKTIKEWSNFRFKNDLMGRIGRFIRSINEEWYNKIKELNYVQKHEGRK